jgi:hypothetical protein
MPAATNGATLSSGSNCTDEAIGPQHRPHVKQSDWDGETMLPSCLGRKLVSAIFLDISMTIPQRDQEILALVVSVGSAKKYCSLRN